MNSKDFIKLVIISSIISTALVLFLLRWPSPPAARAVWQPPEALSFDTPLQEDERINIQIYEALSRSVVNITSTRLEFNFFLQPVPRPGVGSGFFVDSEGHILTNYHVIEDAETLEVTLWDESKADAQVVGVDPINDVALLKIDCSAGECRPIKLAADKELKVGQKVLAIGNPFGLQRTLTTGIISSLGRSLETRTGIMDDLIQTDAAINPGNSGGPLLNTSGEVIGINTAILSRSGESAGIGFAVPATTLQRILPDLIEHGKVLRPWFGVRGRALTPRLAAALNAPVSEGFLIEAVERGSSAARFGLQGGTRRAFYGNRPILLGGDILVELGGRRVASARDIIRILEDKRPGERISIVYYRNGERREGELILVGESEAEGVLRF
ncbi:MAG TPA: trypsin-like peptidase domain-containing protein [Acidobacteriota bacterium]|nr:trypsin-like peptidase domain-containing protein [Acidobacteriota bacterium]